MLQLQREFVLKPKEILQAAVMQHQPAKSAPSPRQVEGKFWQWLQQEQEEAAHTLD